MGNDGHDGAVQLSVTTAGHPARHLHLHVRARDGTGAARQEQARLPGDILEVRAHRRTAVTLRRARLRRDGNTHPDRVITTSSSVARYHLSVALSTHTNLAAAAQAFSKIHATAEYLPFLLAEEGGRNAIHTASVRLAVRCVPH